MIIYSDYENSDKKINLYLLLYHFKY